MASELIPQDVVPIGTGYLILMGVLAAGLRLQRRDAASAGGQDAADSGEARRDHGAAGQGDAAAGRDDAAAGHGARAGDLGPGGKNPGPVARRFAPGWPRFCAQIASVVIGGYVLLMAVDLLYYYGVARVAGQFIDSAFTGPGLLLAISLPLFAGATWLDRRRRRRRSARTGS